MLGRIRVAITATCAALICGAIGVRVGMQVERNAARVDPQAVEPWGIAWSRAVYDSVAPPARASAMCGDGWYSFTRPASQACLGHGGVLVALPPLMSWDQLERWRWMRDSLRTIATYGEQEAKPYLQGEAAARDSLRKQLAAHPYLQQEAARDSQPSIWTTVYHDALVTLDIDRQRIHRTTPTTVNAWMRIAYAQPDTLDDGTVYTVEIQHALYDCAKHRFLPVGIVLLDPTGRTVKLSSTSDRDWAAEPEGSLSAREGKAACAPPSHV